MKKQLINIQRHGRYRYHATFERYTFTSGTRGIQPILLFKNITDENGNPVEGKVCFDDLKCFREVDLEEGDRIAFNARFLDDIELYPDVRYGCKPEIYHRLFYPNKVEKFTSIVKPLHQSQECIVKVPVK